jgi:ankyrin repeat protein
MPHRGRRHEPGNACLRLLIERLKACCAPDELASLLDQLDAQGHSALSAACAPSSTAIGHGRTEVHMIGAVEALLDAGASSALVVCKGCSTALIEASKAPPRLALLRSLLARGVSVDACSFKGGWTPLQTAAEFGNAEAIELLLRRGASIDLVDATGLSALLWACNEGKAEALSVLLRWGADKQRVSLSGITALQFVVARKNPRLRSLLVGETALYPKLQLGDSEDEDEKDEEEDEGSHHRLM